jgi:hypothetical protein
MRNDIQQCWPWISRNSPWNISKQIFLTTFSKCVTSKYLLPSVNSKPFWISVTKRKQNWLIISTTLHCGCEHTCVNLSFECKYHVIKNTIDIKNEASKNNVISVECGLYALCAVLRALWALRAQTVGLFTPPV